MVTDFSAKSILSNEFVVIGRASTAPNVAHVATGGLKNQNLNGMRWSWSVWCGQTSKSDKKWPSYGHPKIYIFSKWLNVAQSGFTCGKATLSHLGRGEGGGGAGAKWLEHMPIFVPNWLAKILTHPPTS